MCGIAGLASLDKPWLYGAAEKMATSLFSRGPDDSGIWIQQQKIVAFAFRRLAILDLTPEGHQPMISKSGRFTIIFNGEIYNFLELKSELESLGESFRGGSDTEVILSGAEKWGFEDLLPRMNGMFAIALWDEQEKQLFLARDRLGKKPLYYGWQSGSFFFASELKAFVATGNFTPVLSGDGVRAFFERGYVPAPLSIYKDVFKLTQGSFLRLSEMDLQSFPIGFSPYPGVSHQHLCPNEYWSILDVSKKAGENEFAGTENEALDAADNILSDAVKKRMISDVPLGAFLSGGIDSSLVVALMQKNSSTPVKTYSIGFYEKEFDESEHAKRVADYLGTTHTELKVSVSEGLDIVKNLPDAYDEPLADASQIPSILVSRMARKEVTVALNGDGGDELFVGYNRYVFPQEVIAKFGKFPKAIRKSIVRGLEALPKSLLTSLVNLSSSILPPGRRPSRPMEAFEKLLRILELDDEDSIYDYLTRYYPPEVSLLPTEYSGAYINSKKLSFEKDFIRRVAALDIGTYLPDDLLAKIDRATMFCSLEGRSPLLDYRLLEFALSLPSRMKIKNGEKKYFLKKLLEKYIPRDLWDRPKVGFSLPVGSWLRNELKSWGEDRLNYLRKHLSEVIDMKLIDEKWNDHQSGKKVFSNEIWTALVFSQWHERWMGRK